MPSSSSAEKRSYASSVTYADGVAAAHAELAARYEALAAVFGAKRLTELPIDYN